MFMFILVPGLIPLLITLTVKDLSSLQRHHTRKQSCPDDLDAYLRLPVKSPCNPPQIQHGAPGSGKGQAPEAVCAIVRAAHLPKVLY